MKSRIAQAVQASSSFGKSGSGTGIRTPSLPGGRADRLDALVAELRGAGVEVYSATFNPFTQGDLWNIWCRWGNARLNLTSTASVRRHIARIAVAS
jgi:hypothetical protein